MVNQATCVQPIPTQHADQVVTQIELWKKKTRETLPIYSLRKKYPLHL